MQNNKQPRIYSVESAKRMFHNSFVVTNKIIDEHAEKLSSDELKIYYDKLIEMQNKLSDIIESRLK